MKSYYDITSLLFMCNSDADSIDGCAQATVLYDGSYIKPMYDLKSNAWVESAAKDEIEAFLLQKKTLLAELCDENNYTYINELEIEYDKCPFLTKKCFYGVKGILNKIEYSYNDKLIVLEMQEVAYDRKTHAGFAVENVPVSLTIGTRFLLDEKTYKEVVRKIDLNPSPCDIEDSNNKITAVNFSSFLIEEFLAKNRANADFIFKSFNSLIYRKLYSFYDKQYLYYLNTGDSSLFKDAILSEKNTDILFFLNKKIDEKNLIELNIPVDSVATVKDFILINLQ